MNARPPTGQDGGSPSGGEGRQALPEHPQEPSTPPGEGIVIFLHADFAGPSQALNVDVPDLGNVEGACGETPRWSDCISSVKVNPGWAATLYRDKDYKGASVTVKADTPNLRDLRGPCDNDSFNDCVSSIRVSRQ
jgi:hypothetical protein